MHFDHSQDFVKIDRNCLNWVHYSRVIKVDQNIFIQDFLKYYLLYFLQQKFVDWNIVNSQYELTDVI